jgi:hypothetical protein
LCEQVLDALLCEKVVGVLDLAEPLEEHGQVVVVVELVDADLCRQNAGGRYVEECGARVQLVFLLNRQRT